MVDVGGAVSELVSELEEREIFTLVRRRKGLTQGDVARRAGVARPTVSRWEAGTFDLGDDARGRLWAVVGVTEVAA